MICIHTHTQWNIIQPIKKKEILPYAVIGMDLEGIMLSDIIQTEKDKYCMFSHVESKKSKLKETGSRMVVARGLEMGEMGCSSKGTNFQL